MDFLKKITKPVTSATETPPTKTEKSGDENQTTENAPSSQPDLLSSANLVADAAQSAFKHEPTKYDNTEVAGASADIFDAAGRYGKLENTAVGGYVEQAEEYLHNYETSNSTAPLAAKNSENPEEITDAPGKPAEEAVKSEADENEIAAPVPTEESAEEAVETAAPDPTDEPVKNEEGKYEGGVGDYAKESEEFLEKNENSGETEGDGGANSEGGVGDYIKDTEGFLEKNKISDETEGDGEPKSEGGVGDYVNAAEGFLNKQSEDSESTGYGDALKSAGDFSNKN